MLNKPYVVYLFIFSLYSPSAFSEVTCAEVLNRQVQSTVFWGDRVSPDSAPLVVPPGTEVFRLGSGIAGGTVYRTRSTQNGEVHTYKVYHHLRFIEPDVSKLRILEKLAAQQGYDGLKAVKVLSLNDLTVEYENIFGRSLDSVLRELSDVDRQNLIDRYNDLMAKTWQAMAVHLPEFNKQGFYNASFKSDSGQTLNFFFKHENIIYNSDSKVFTIIDPF